MTVSLATRDDLPDALALLYDVAPEDRPAYLAHAYRLMARGDLDPADFWLARDDSGRLAGVMALRELPGAAGVVWPPRTDPPGREGVEDDLMRAALAHLTRATVLQTFLPPAQRDLAAPLLRHGFAHITDVLHMEHPGGVHAVAGELELADADADSPAFERLLTRCHEDSADCPELNHGRTAADLIAGYRDTAPEPHGWCVAVRRGHPVGIAIAGMEDLAFLGLVPEARGQGLGVGFLNLVLDRMAGPCRLTVDERNAPARRLYERVGFVETDARQVYLWFA